MRVYNIICKTQKITKMKTTNIIDISSTIDFTTIKGYPILIKGAYLQDMVPEETGYLGQSPKTCSYGFNYNEDEDYEEYLLNDREQVYELIKDITTAISKALTHRYTHEWKPGKLLGAPHDDETSDISNAIDLLAILDKIGNFF